MNSHLLQPTRRALIATSTLAVSDVVLVPPAPLVLPQAIDPASSLPIREESQT